MREKHSGAALLFSSTAPHVYLCEFNISRISMDPSIRLLVACIADQLTVPHSKIMFAICPLRKYGDS